MDPPALYQCGCGLRLYSEDDVTDHKTRWVELGHGKTCPDPDCKEKHQRKSNKNSQVHWEGHLPKALRPQFSCSACGNKYAKNQNLTKHMNDKHSAGPSEQPQAVDQPSEIVQSVTAEPVDFSWHDVAPLQGFEPVTTDTATTTSAAESWDLDLGSLQAFDSLDLDLNLVETGSRQPKGGSYNYQTSRDHDPPSLDHESPRNTDGFASTIGFPVNQAEPTFVFEDDIDAWTMQDVAEGTIPVSDPNSLNLEQSGHKRLLADQRAQGDMTRNIKARPDGRNVERHGTISMQQQERISIMRSLEFDHMDSRRIRVDKSCDGTSDWVFDQVTTEPPSIDFADQVFDQGTAERPPNNFPDWLRTQNGLFLILGKAGSGKSTLLKHIIQSKKCDQMLEDWARVLGCKLVAADFFFWRVGTSLEKTREGLSQSLLLQVFEKSPDLMPVLIPAPWESILERIHRAQWSMEELMSAMTLLATLDTTANVCFCFFIDGLDEYQGEEDKLVQDLQALVQSPRIKICATSRPRTQLVAFTGSNNAKSLVLHEHTASDMRQFVQTRLEENCHSRDLASWDRAGIDSIVETIQRRANGVFLWVVFVVQGLMKELGHLGNLEELRDRLDCLPRDIESYFTEMINTTDRDDRPYMARLLLLIDWSSRTRRGKSIKPEAAYFLGKQCEHDFQEFARLAIARVKKWCHDMIEVRGDGVFFFHQTFADYLDLPEPRRQLVDLAGPDFNAPSTFFRLSLSCCRYHLKVEVVRQYPTLWGDLFDALKDTLEAALYCETDNKETPRKELNALDSDLTLVFGTVRPQELLHAQRLDILVETDTPDDIFDPRPFLTLAASVGLLRFVEYEMRSMESQKVRHVGPYVLRALLTFKWCELAPSLRLVKYDYLSSRVRVAELLVDELQVDINTKLKPLLCQACRKRDLHGGCFDDCQNAEPDQWPTVWGYFLDYLEYGFHWHWTGPPVPVDRFLLLVQFAFRAGADLKYWRSTTYPSLVVLLMHALVKFKKESEDDFRQLRDLLVQWDVEVTGAEEAWTCAKFRQKSGRIGGVPHQPTCPCSRLRMS